MGTQINTPPSWEPLWTPQQAGDYLQVHEKTVIRFARQGVIPALRLGKKLWRFRKIDLERWAAGTISSGHQPDE